MEAELQKGKEIFRASGRVGNKIQVSQVHSIFFFFSLQLTTLSLNPENFSFLFPRVAGNEVK